MAKFLEWLTGSEDKFEQLPNYNAGQNRNLDQLTDITQEGGQGLQSVLKYLMSFLDPNSEEYKNFEQPYLDEFNQETVPMLAEQYAGKGALSSSGFAQSLSSAGAGLQHKLAAMKSGLKMQAADSLRNQYNTNVSQSLSAKPYDYQRQKGSPGLLPTAAAGAVSTFTGGGGLSELIRGLINRYGGGGGSNIGGNIQGSAGVR